MRVPKHPGKLLREELQARGLSANRLAIEIRVPANRITEILNERRSVTPETALRLGRYFGTGPEFWLNLQVNHDLGKAKAEFGDEIERTVTVAA